MHPTKADRSRAVKLTDLPNIGPASAKDLECLGIHRPDDLIGKCPFDMYQELCLLTATRHDPCVIDVFISVTRFIAGDPPQPWWAFTAMRKDILKHDVGVTKCGASLAQGCPACGRCCVSGFKNPQKIDATNREILQNAGKISKSLADERALLE